MTSTCQANVRYFRIFDRAGAIGEGLENRRYSEKAAEVGRILEAENGVFAARDEIENFGTALLNIFGTNGFRN
ncbi:hypothetical protein IQ270_02845 [Microcoleus sp. LEGE 07076]|uniref:hypothetical protein n=1 Tax=Microcoleus sp. LEGE 07076 TaxID=915322 RepID=UPI00187E6804|nr:hypothetical protein [Microcoleus sp. LEGE 07076]MBE9183689.1 hypothetical protein [Microcoleus sp. LEGE 07076]